MKNNLVIASYIREDHAIYEDIEDLHINLRASKLPIDIPKKPYFVQFCEPFARDDENRIVGIIESLALTARPFVINSQCLSWIQTKNGKYALVFLFEEVPKNKSFLSSNLREKLPECIPCKKVFLPVAYLEPDRNHISTFERIISETTNDIMIKVDSIALLCSPDLKDWVTISDTILIDSSKKPVETQQDKTTTY